MSANAGYQCILQIGATPTTITGIKSVDVTISGDIYDITAFSDGQWKKKLGGLADYTLKFSGNLDMSDLEQQALQATLITSPGSQIQWKIWPTGTGGTHNYSGTVLGKQEAIKFDVSKEQTVDFDFEGTGAIVYV